MKALVLTEIAKMEIKDIEEPKPLPKEVKIQMKYVGICGTDKHLYQGLPGSATATPPIVLGHENSGVVVEVGHLVESLKVGDRVTVDPNIPCLHCRYCHEGKIHLCENLEAVGVTRNGGMEEFVTVPERCVYKIPDSLSYKAAAMTEPVSCVVHGFQELEIKQHYKTLVIGDGFVGQLFISLLKARNVGKIYVSGHNEKKIPLLKEIGADVVFDPEKDQIDETFDVIIECVGRPNTQEQAIQMAARGGQILMFGVGDPDTNIQVNAYDVYFKELIIKGAFINPHVMEDAISILDHHVIDVEKLITHELALDEVEAVLSGENKEKITKAVVKIS